MAFVGVAGGLSSRGVALPSRCSNGRQVRTGRVAVQMVSINPDAGYNSDPVLSWAPTVQEFMNKDHKHDLVQYFIQLGTSNNVKDPEIINDIALTGVDKNGLQIDVVLCEEADGRCVCLQDFIPWADSRMCKTIDDICGSLSKMSRQCGLSSEF
ncbi:hypothetical protein NDN08_005050 [Rhodosorus marinus]|uniref:DUF2470 domain-containing protein n=1 Tax=Rhodosorus marinus TaxID=101924 RepID=A0AAV8V0S1_9RHOD|nr:hypothetical protein NDN08_005050 [Rhodosorus marinus]